MSFSRDLYKTKLCNLYQRGHCPRQSCSFAHGDAELRRFSGGGGGAFTGRRDFRGGDLRERLERRHSPRSKRFSPGRDDRGRGRSHSRSPLRSRPSRSASPLKTGLHKSDRKDKKRLRINGSDAHFSDVSGDMDDPLTWENESAEKVAKSPSTDHRDLLEEELHEVLAEIDSFNDRVIQAQSSLDKKAHEINELSAKNVELDSKLHKEHEHHKRLLSKVKKFVKVYLRCSRAQEEVKKTQARLQKLVDDFPLGSITKVLLHGEDSDVNILSEGEPDQPLNNNEETKIRHMSAAKDDSDMDGNAPEFSGDLTKRVSSASRSKSRIAKSSKTDLLEIDGSKDTDADERDWSNVPSIRLVTSDKADRVGLSYSDDLSNKVRTWDMAVNLPATGLAAHADDDVPENDDEKQVSAVVKTEENARAEIFQSLPEKSDLHGMSGVPQMPIIVSNQYAEYEGDDEDVDVENVDEGIDNPGGINLNVRPVQSIEKGKTPLFPIT